MARMNDHVDQLKAAGDVLSVTAVIGSLAGLLPVVAAFLSIVWSLIRIYETRTFQKFIKRGSK